MSLLWFLLIIAISIFVHELGHYLAARAQGVGVRNFAVGFGPTLLGFERWGTTWRLNLIPLGGYAEIEGMQPGDTQGYAQLSGWGKFLILIGGIVMNLLLAWSLLGFLGSTQGFPNLNNTRAEVSSVVPGSLAERVGFKAGDQIIALDGQPLTDFQEVSKFRAQPGEKVFTVLRGGQTLELRFNWDGREPRLGIAYGPVVTYQREPFWLGFAKAASNTVTLFPRIVREIVGGLLRLFEGQQVAGLAGPVGIVNATSQAAQAGGYALLVLLANINLSLAIFNLLPIPGLDGGRIFVLVLNFLSGGRIRPEMEARLAYGGFIFVLLLIVLVTINDIRNLSGG
ncbi:M50 family metallopeptidase [Meiothermus granaticius]|uniref:Regulator of sigma-W protease RasP n=1 Tax=Meiothermus granaticius NBRC 107808 TaxID=1227551 RepID=A0A399FEV1_9DEIN|nr:M50 family metallopeptidase [Meiothermus granaticius]RIH93561.1 Regulator of sigma-W protease RasP [Meiothermus granaticius NBRC 107808]GEM86057.1 peptidase [Meiothermus granaticius NBRC 107808]